MITIKPKGDYKKVEQYFKKLRGWTGTGILERYAEEALTALMVATPVDSGLTAQSWYYEIENQDGIYKISFCNSNINHHVPIAIILQYGHATGTGGWVQGRDYINPAIRPIFDKIIEKAREEVIEL